MTHKVRYDNLSIIRMIACIGVLLVHLGGCIQLPESIRPFFEAGSSGVTMFFILTGFLGMESYGNAKAKGEKLPTWYAKKAVRILPVYFVAILIHLIAHQLILQDVPADPSGLYWTRYFCFLSQMVPSDIDFWRNLGITWSVSVFILWYLLTPLVHKLVKNIYVSILAFGLLYGLEKVLNRFDGWASPFRFLQYCMLGVVLYYAVKIEKEKILAALAVLLLWALVIKSSDSALIPALFTMIFLCVTMGMQVKNDIFRKLLAFFDTYSYGIYIMQGVMLLVLSCLSITNPILVTAIFLMGSALLAVLVNLCVEKPLQKLMKKRNSE